MSVAPVRKAVHGQGRATLQAFGKDAVFSELSFTYPLKLMSPKISTDTSRAVAIAYVLSYGGGLISSDRIDVAFDVGLGAILMLLTQGSTKVFRARAKDRIRASSSRSLAEAGSRDLTAQSLIATVAPDACLLLLPDPVTCFSDASYSQIQTFRLSDATSSAGILDWYTSGRMFRGEEWAFRSYRSVNEVWVGGKRVARDVQLLEAPTGMPGSPLALRALGDRMAPYSCYATLLLFGPLLEQVIQTLKERMDQITVFQRSAPEDPIWSLSLLESGAILRIAGRDTESVKFWIKDALKPLVSVVGTEAFDKTFV